MLVVAEILRHRPDYDIKFVAENVALQRLQESGAPLTAISEMRSVDLIIVGSSIVPDSGETCEMELLRLADRRGIRSLVVTDLWLNGLPVSKGTAPTIITAEDPATAEIMQQHRPSSRIVCTGNPVFDPIATIDYLGTRAALREQLGLLPDETFVYFLYGYDDDSPEYVRLLIEALNILKGEPFRLAVRSHPRLFVDPRFAVERRQLEELLSAYPGQLIDTRSFPNGEAVLPAADIVVSNYSTVSTAAMYYCSQFGSPMALHLLAAADYRKFAELMFGTANVPAAVTLGAAACIRPHELNVTNVVHQLIELTRRTARIGYHQRCQKAFTVDGKATQRIADLALWLLNE